MCRFHHQLPSLILKLLFSLEFSARIVQVLIFIRASRLNWDDRVTSFRTVRNCNHYCQSTMLSQSSASPCTHMEKKLLWVKHHQMTSHKQCFRGIYLLQCFTFAFSRCFSWHTSRLYWCENNKNSTDIWSDIKTTK